MLHIFEMLLKRYIITCRSMYVKQTGSMHTSKEVYGYKCSSSDRCSSPKYPVHAGLKSSQWQLFYDILQYIIIILF